MDRFFIFFIFTGSSRSVFRLANTENSLAYMEMKVIIARLIWNFNISLAPESNSWMENQKVFNLWEKGPLIIQLEPALHN